MSTPGAENPSVAGTSAVSGEDMKALAQAFEAFTESTRTMEASYRQLQQRLEEMSRELAAKNRALEVTTDYLNSILDGMSDGVIAVDTDGNITTFNHAAAEVLGYAPGSVEGMPFQEVFGRAFEGPPGRRAMELKNQQGEPVTVSERDAPLADRQGQRIGAVKVFQDLSELEDLRKQVRRKDRLAAIGEMAATVAHEIRNPLGGIRGFAALLSRDVQSDESASRLVGKILGGTEDLQRVVDELLEYTRPIEIRPRALLAADLVDAAIGYLEPGVARVSVENRVAAELEVSADPDRLRQVLLNLLLNAAQSIEAEGQVVVEATESEVETALTVRDTGCGMAPDLLENVFMPFYTTKEKGTGLGLAVAAKIAEAHGGRIEAESTPGQGTMMRVVLPRGG